MVSLRHKRRKAFTLIELLVVVAILAILAAIAVPNYLNAQARAKVSTAWEDMRTLALALEAYNIDQNRYPPDFSDVNKNPLFGSFLPRLIPLTTPIAYCSSVAEDPFAKASIGKSPAHAQAYQIPFGSGSFFRPYTYDYAKRDWADAFDAPDLWVKVSSHPHTVQWTLKSVGPSLESSWLGDGTPAYDATNGVRSVGHLYFSGPSIGPDKPSL